MTSNKYFRLGSDRVQMVGRIEKVSGPEIPRFTCGELYPPVDSDLYDPADDVFPFQFTYLDRHGKTEKPHLDFYGGDSLMSRRLVKTLEAAGVNNIQTFDAVITNEKTKAVIKDFVLVNIVGLVAAADMSKSKALPLGPGHVFTELKIDPAKPRGMLMFRLAESFDVIVHERVAKAIKAGGFTGLVLTPVSR